MWLTCDYHMTPYYNQLLLEQLMCCNAQRVHCYDNHNYGMLHPVHHKKCSMYTRPFPSSKAGSENKTNIHVLHASIDIEQQAKIDREAYQTG